MKFMHKHKYFIYMIISIVMVLIFSIIKNYSYAIDENKGTPNTYFLSGGNATIEIYSPLRSIDEVQLYANVIHMYTKNSMQNYLENFSPILKGNIYNDLKFIINGNYYINVKVYDKNNNMIYDKDISYASIETEKALVIKFNTLKDYIWKKLRIELTDISTNHFKEISFNTLQSSVYNKLIVDGNQQYISLGYSAIGRSHNYLLFWLSVCLFLITTAYICFKSNYKSILDKLYLKINNGIYFVEFIFSLILTYSLFKIIVSSTYYGMISIFYLLLLILSIIFITHIIIKNIKRVPIEKIYLLIIIPISICYCILLIPHAIPDENSHYAKAYSVSEGIYHKIQTNFIPSDSIRRIVDADTRYASYEQINKEIEEKTDYNTIVSMEGTANNYEAILYYPSSIGIKMARDLGLNAYTGYYMGRIMNLIMMIVFGFMCIKLIPYGKKVMFIYLLNPMYIHQGVSLSADSLTNTFCLMFICYILSLIHNRDECKKGILTYVWMLVLGLLVIKSKSVYFPLLLLITLLLRKDKSIKLSKKKLNRVKIMGICILLYVVLSNLVFRDAAYGLTIQNVILHPFDMLSLTINTIVQKGSAYLTTFCGSNLGWLKINVRSVYVILYMIILLSSPFMDKNDKVNVTRYEKILYVIISLTIIILMHAGFLAVYYKEQLARGYIELLQGRYFIPFAILLLLPLIRKKQIIKINDYLIYALLTMIHINVLVDIVLYFI